MRRRKRRRARVFCGTPAPGPRARTFLGSGMTQLSATWVPDHPLGTVVCCSTIERWSHSHHVSAELGSSTLRGIASDGGPCSVRWGSPLPWHRLGFKLTSVGQPGHRSDLPLFWLPSRLVVGPSVEIRASAGALTQGPHQPCRRL